MKNISIYLLLALYVFSLLVFPCTAAADPESDAVQLGCSTLDAKLPLLGTEQLVDNAKSVLLYEVNTQTLMYAWNADERLSPASLVKILTALIAIEKCDLSSEVTVNSAVLNSVVSNAVKTGFADGEIITLGDLLYCMMVDSGNDAAALIADFVCGNQSDFVVEMNNYAQQLGCVNTNFTNVHGLHDDNQYTTARDMGRILSASVQNEVFCEIFGTVRYAVPENNLSDGRYLVSENYLMNDDDVQIYYDSRVVGSRTGVSQDGFRCVASLAEGDGLRFVSIVMGSASVYESNGVTVRSFGGYSETSDILDCGFDGFKNYQIIHRGQILRQLPVVDGDCQVSLGAYTSASTVLPSGISETDLTIRYENVSDEFTAPIQKGQRLSTVKYMYGHICVAQVDLYAMNSVHVKTDMVEDTSENARSGSAVLVTVLIIILVLIVIMFIGTRVLRLLKRKTAKHNRQVHRQNRRRSK